jgi:hypothetical protein
MQACHISKLLIGSCYLFIYISKPLIGPCNLFIQCILFHRVAYQLILLFIESSSSGNLLTFHLLHWRYALMPSNHRSPSNLSEFFYPSISYVYMNLLVSVSLPILPLSLLSYSSRPIPIPLLMRWLPSPPGCGLHITARLSCHAAANVLSYQFPFSLYEDNKVSALQPPSRTVRWWGSTDLLVIDRRRSLQDDILRPIIPYQYLMFVARSMDFKCCYLYPSFSPIFVSQLPKPFQEQLALVLILYWRWRHEVG